MGLCYLLIPRFDWRFRNEEGDCVLPAGHFGNHLNPLNDGRYLSWGGCGCNEDCGWCDECFWWEKISRKQALAILSGKKENLNF